MKLHKFARFILCTALIAGFLFAPIAAPQFAAPFGSGIAVAADKTIRIRTALTGGGASALDGIDGAGLLDGELAFTTVSSVLYVHLLDDDSGAAESSPNVISPDTNAGNKRWILQGSYGNVKFPATQVPSADANTLDDYEEGTWTMALSFGGASTGITYSSQAGRYTKIGRVIIYDGYMALSSKGTATGAAVISGLPVAAGGYAAVVSRMYKVGFANAPQHYIASAGTSINLGEITEAGVGSVLADTDFQNDSAVMVSGVYMQ
ncbi:MAG: hypothetical protein ACYC7J_18325 [Syntrophales bacterium]